MYLLLHWGVGGCKCRYIGCTTQVRRRLLTHERERQIMFTRFEVIPCASLAEARQLEADLIFQHQPVWNTQGKKARRFVA